MDSDEENPEEAVSGKHRLSPPSQGTRPPQPVSWDVYRLVPGCSDLASQFKPVRASVAAGPSVTPGTGDFISVGSPPGRRGARPRAARVPPPAWFQHLIGW